MSKLTTELKSIISHYNAGSVASINDDGSPAVSPKATFVIIDDSSIAFGDIRSPKTVNNLKQRPQTEINFIDILSRKAARISGTARIVAKGSEEWDRLLPDFEKLWAPYIEMMDNFVVIDIVNASIVTSPAYDIGISREELIGINMQKLEKWV